MRIKLVGFDIDGVLTNGQITLGADSELCKSFFVQDGYGIKQLLKANIVVVLISGRSGTPNALRAEELGITGLYENVKNKLTCLKQICSEHQISLSECVFVGDDIPDLACIQSAGTGIAVANAVLEVKRAANWVTENTGGHGAAREVCDWILSHHAP